jgi:hypothetical protein
MKNLEFRKYLEVREIEPTSGNRTVVNPVTKKPWRADQRYDQLAAIMKDQAQKGLDPNRIWVTFSSLPKLGIRPYKKGGKTTPQGVFGFPANYVISKKLVSSFAARRYMIVFYFDGPHMEIGYSNDKNESEYEDHQKWKDKLTPLSYSNTIQKQKNDFISKSGVNSSRSISELIYNISNSVWLKLDKEEKSESIFDPKEILNGLKYNAWEEIEHHLTKEFYFSDNFYWKPIFIKFNPVDLTVEFNPDYIKKALYKDNRIPQKKMNKIKPDKKYHFLEALNLIGQSYKKRELEKNLRTLKFQTMPPSIVKALEKWKKDFFTYLNRDQNKDLENYPLKKILQPIADEYGLDFPKLVMNTYRTNTITNDQLAIYKITQQMAREIGEKTNQYWPAIWSKLLQKLGRQGIMDTKDTGNIHSGEPTQGVFLNPKYIRVITVIDNMKYDTGLTDPKGHEYPVLNKRGEEETWEKNISNRRRTIISLTHNLQTLWINLNNSLYYNNIPSIDYLVSTLKVLKTAKTVLKGSKHANKETEGLLMEINKIKKVIQTFYGKMHTAEPIIQQVLQQIMSVLNDEDFPKTLYGPKASKKYSSKNGDWI